MARRGKGQLIEAWEHYRYKSEKANIYLSKEDGMFSADYGDRSVSSHKLEDLRNELGKLVESMVQLKWIPVICISLRGGARFHRNKKTGRLSTTEEELDSEDERTDTGSADFNLEFRRFWMAKEPSGEWLSCEVWFSQDDDGKSDRYNPDHDHFNEPMPRRLNARRFYLHGEEIKKFTIPWKSVDNSFNEQKNLHYVKYTPQLWAGLNEVAFKVEQLIENLKNLLGSERGLLLVESLVQKMLPAASAEVVHEENRPNNQAGRSRKAVRS